MKRNLLGYMLCVFILLECFPQLAIAAPEQEGERYKVAIMRLDDSEASENWLVSAGT